MAAHVCSPDLDHVLLRQGRQDVDHLGADGLATAMIAKMASEQPKLSYDSTGCGHRGSALALGAACPELRLHSVTSQSCFG